jgi:hypothetical protein
MRKEDKIKIMMKIRMNILVKSVIQAINVDFYERYHP